MAIPSSKLPITHQWEVGSKRHSKQRFTQSVAVTAMVIGMFGLLVLLLALLL